jgi:hypothetical protein
MKHFAPLLGVALVGINVSSALAQYQPRPHADRTLGYSACASAKQTLHFQPNKRVEIHHQPISPPILAPGTGTFSPSGPVRGSSRFGGGQPGAIPGPGLDLRVDIPPKPKYTPIPEPGTGSHPQPGPVGGGQPGAIPGPGRDLQVDIPPKPKYTPIPEPGTGSHPQPGPVGGGQPGAIPEPGRVASGPGADGETPGSRAPIPIPGPVARWSASKCLTSAGECGLIAPQWARDNCWCTGPLGEQYSGMTW